MDMPETLPVQSTDDEFETAIRETVNAVGGTLLFKMKLEDGDSCRWTAAVAIEDGGKLEVVIIDLPCGADSGNVSVSPAAQSDLPIAHIATAYASLAECWSKAA
ncbi:hypothetical protein [Mesorhizobium sp. CAU 1741]|uniref:hypothetical protein n=1 Tax=Mesorhizobium sp. CAU 1741 TaxID=3140366 RepID=UPI00325A49D2